LSVVGTVGKALFALCGAGVVAAAIGKGTLAVVLVVSGAVGGAIGVVSDARAKALERREARAAADQEREAAAVRQEDEIASALLFRVCPVGEVPVEESGVDAVDPGVLERALRVEGDQLPYVTRGEFDERLREHLARARSGDGLPLVCVYGPAKAGKSRSMLHALKVELPDAVMIAPAHTRENLQTILDHEVLQQAAGVDQGVVLWLDDLEGFIRVGNQGLDANRLIALKQTLPGLVVAATAGGRGCSTQGARQSGELYEPLEGLLSRGARVRLGEGLTTAAERAALARVVPPELAAEDGTRTGRSCGVG
jgi:hypothetical protein